MTKKPKGFTPANLTQTVLDCNTYHTLVTITAQSAGWFLKAWRLFVARASAITT